ncbi:light-harvesting antenna LH1, alpha subunit [Thiocystis minor]|uniref:light-harvesting antenna LH1, alpha subunit n=1 Tax=Thiocystis minor TaxID=61597 RepID=UPI0030B8A80C
MDNRINLFRERSSMQKMWQIWQYFDVRMIIVGTVGSMFTLAFVIHLLLFSSPTFNWFQSSETLPPAAAQMVPLPKGR